MSTGTSRSHHLRLRDIPVAGRVLIGATILAGIAAVAFRIPGAVGDWTLRDAGTAALLAAAMLAVEQLSIPLRRGSETLNFTLTDAAWTAGLMLVRPDVLTIALAVGVLVGQRLKGWQPLKAAFNVGVYLVGITGAEVVYAAFGTPGAQHPAAWLAAALGMAIVAVANSVLVALVIALTERRAFLSVLVPPLGVDFLHRAGNLAIGIVLAVQAAAAPLALPFSAVMFGLAYATYRGWVQSLRERERIQHLYEAGRMLMRPLNSAADFTPMLDVVTPMLQASSVELSVIRDGEVVVHASTAGDPDAAAEELAGPPQTVLVAGENGIRAVLAVHRERPLSDAERTVLDVLASQVSTMLENQRVFVETMERAELAKVVAHTWDGIFMLSAEGTILTWNPSMERLTGYPSEEAVGRPSADILGILPGPNGLRTAAGETYGEDGNVRDVILTSRDGSERWVRYTRYPMGPEDHGAPGGQVVVARDVTAELEAEQLKADLVATVSHELRTPLTPLKGFLVTLLRGAGDTSPEERQEYYRIMLNQTNRLESLIVNLLEASRIESGEPMVDPERFDLSTLVNERVQDFRLQHPHRSIRLRTVGAPVSIDADRLRTDQVLSNLLSNALKYAPADAPVEVVIEVGPKMATTSVRDAGPGIAPSEQRRIFDRFYRVHNGHRAKAGGTGLGLYIAKRLVENMGGQIGVTSTPGEGATFSFTLPLTDDSSSGQGARPAEALIPA